MIGIRYSGALHLWLFDLMHFYKYFAALPLKISLGRCNLSLQILCGAAAFK